MNSHSIFIAILITSLQSLAQAQSNMDSSSYEISKKMLILSAYAEERNLVNRFLNEGTKNLTAAEIEKVDQILRRLSDEIKKTNPMMTRE